MLYSIFKNTNSLENVCRLIFFPTNTPCIFHVETTWKRSFSRRFKVEYTWCVCSLISKKPSLSLKSKFHPGRFTNFIEHFKSLFLRTNIEWQKQNYLFFYHITWPATRGMFYNISCLIILENLLQNTWEEIQFR